MTAGSRDGCDFLLVDDHPLLQMGLAAELRARGHQVEIGETFDREALLSQIARVGPEVVVLDHGLPDLGDGLDLIRPVADLGPTVVMLTGTIDEVMWGHCVARGAWGVINKAEPFEAIIDGLTAVLGKRPIHAAAASRWRAAASESKLRRDKDLAPFELLSSREKVVLLALIRGQSAAAIAEAEFVSLATVRSQIKSILRKLGVSSQLEAVARSHAAGWVAATPDRQPDPSDPATG